MINEEYFLPEAADQQQFQSEIQQWQELRDLEYQAWAELLDGEYWAMWYDFVERGEPR